MSVNLSRLFFFASPETVQLVQSKPVCSLSLPWSFYCLHWLQAQQILISSQRLEQKGWGSDWSIPKQHGEQNNLLIQCHIVYVTGWYVLLKFPKIIRKESRCCSFTLGISLVPLSLIWTILNWDGYALQDNWNKVLQGIKWFALNEKRFQVMVAVH